MKRNKLSLLLEGDAKANGDIPPEGNRVTDEEGSIKLDQEGSRASAELTKLSKIEEAEEKLKRSVRLEPAVKKIVKASARLADLLTDEDQLENLRVIREAKKAKSRLWDPEAKQWIESPDSRIQLAAATLDLAYGEGLPVKRSIVLTGNFANAEELAQALRSSPEAAKALQTLAGLGIGIEDEGEIVEMEPNNGEDGELSNDQEEG